MGPTTEQLSKLQKKATSFRKNFTKPSLSDVYNESKEIAFNEFNLFLLYYNTIPNFDYLRNINFNEASDWILKHHSADIKDCSYIKRYVNGGKLSEVDDIYFFLYEDLLIRFDKSNDHVKFLYRNTPLKKVQELIRNIGYYKKPVVKYTKSEIAILVSYGSGFDLKQLSITKPKLSIDDNYNEDFKAIHQTIFKRLSKKHDKGLVLLHGKPGTGKTSYIRYLVASVKKQVIFLPPNMATALTNPELIGVLIENPNSVFVIEDAENIIMDRESNGASPVSALLNIADGLLSDCLNVQIICSFNTDISKVDSALMRKGRLIAKYEFKELETTKAQALSTKLGFTSIITQPMTLTEIYNQEERDFSEQKHRRTIGFKAA